MGFRSGADSVLLLQQVAGALLAFVYSSDGFVKTNNMGHFQEEYNSQ